jgi:environmental stress-induced protein Ves
MSAPQLQVARSRVVPANEYRRERWRNGAGWTREIAAEPGDGGEWVWRLSIAEIEQDAPFSRFPGVDREIVLLSGNGVRLRFDDGSVHPLEPPHGRLRFSGEAGVQGELIDGRRRTST